MADYDPNDPDSAAWASEFCRVATNKNFDPKNPVHIEWVKEWFKNAMQVGYECGGGA